MLSLGHAFRADKLSHSPPTRIALTSLNFLDSAMKDAIGCLIRPIIYNTYEEKERTKLRCR